MLGIIAHAAVFMSVLLFMVGDLLKMIVTTLTILGLEGGCLSSPNLVALFIMLAVSALKTMASCAFSLQVTANMCPR